MLKREHSSDVDARGAVVRRHPLTIRTEWSSQLCPRVIMHAIRHQLPLGEHHGLVPVGGVKRDVGIRRVFFSRRPRLMKERNSGVKPYYYIDGAFRPSFVQLTR